MKGVTFCAALAAAACAFGDTAYDVVTAWDTVSSANYQDGTGDLTAANGWTQPDEGGASVTNCVIEVALGESAGELSYSAKPPTATNRFETAYVALTDCIADGVLDTSAHPQAALTAYDDGTAANWYGWCGGDAAGWRKLKGATPAEGACVVRTEFDNRGDDRLVRYAVKQGSATDFTVLTAEDGTAWLTNGLAAASSARVHRVGIGGAASFTNIVLTQTGTVTVKDGGKIAQRMAEQEIAAADLNKTAANGNSNWENLVLGLDGKTATSKAVVLPLQTADPDSVSLKLGGVDVDVASGATVKYRVWSGSTLGGHEGGATGLLAHDQAQTVALPNSGVMYYTMDVVTIPAQ